MFESQFSFPPRNRGFLFETSYFTITHSILPREVDPLVYNMSAEDPGNVQYNAVGGLSKQVRELREVSL